MAYARQFKNGSWQGVYRNAEGRKVYTAQYSTKREAKAEAERQQLKVQNSTWVDPNGGKLTVREWAEHWMKVQTASIKTLATYQHVLDYYVLPRWGDVQLRAIETSAVRQWVATMTGTRTGDLSPATKRKAYRVLSSMLMLAVEEDRLAVNKALDKNGRSRFVPTGESRIDHVYLTPRQLRRLAAVASEPYATMILFMGVTGLRPGEALALTVADFDMLRARVKVTRAFSSIDGKRPTLKSTKTDAGRRVVPFDKSLIEPLSRIMQGKSRDALVFPSPEGKPLPQQNLRNRMVAPAVQVASRAVATLQEALGVTPVDGSMDERTEVALKRFQAEHGLTVTGRTNPETWGKLAAEATRVREGELLRNLSPVELRRGDQDFPSSMRVYDLRHTAASLMVSAGANVKSVQAVLGHKRASMTLDIYAGLFQDDADAVAERMSGILGQDPASPVPHDLGSAQVAEWGITPVQGSDLR